MRPRHIAPVALGCVVAAACGSSAQDATSSVPDTAAPTSTPAAETTPPPSTVEPEPVVTSPPTPGWMPGDELDVIPDDALLSSFDDDTIVRCTVDAFRLGDLRNAQRLADVGPPELIAAVDRSGFTAPAPEDWWSLGEVVDEQGFAGTEVIGVAEDQIVITAYVSLPDELMLVRAWEGDDCDLFVGLAGLGSVEWEVEPGTLDPTATQLTVLVTEQGCASGRLPGDRLLGPDVAETDEEIRIAFGVIPPGGADCPGNPSTPVVIELDAPLGDRRVVDGLSIGASLAEVLGSGN